VSDSYLFYLVGQVVGRYHLSTGIHDGTYFEASEGSSPLGLAHDGTGVYVFFENEALKINDSDQVQETINIRGGRQSTMTRDYYVLTGETLRLVSRTDSSLAEIEIDARSPLSAASDGRYVYAVFSESSDRRKIISYDTLTGSIQNLADRFGVGGLAVDGRGLWMTNRAMNKIIADSIQYACTTVIDGCDVFPLDPEEWFDTDKDGIGNNADTDDDEDGVLDINDSSPLDPMNDSDGDGVANIDDMYPENSLYVRDSDSDGMPDAWETLYGLDPYDPSDASSDLDNDGVTAINEFLAGTVPSGSIDLDGNEKYDALTDGLMLLRRMFGYDGSALIAGTIASDAVYTDAADIEYRIEILGELADIDGNGRVDALTDGLLILRYLFGYEGDSLINGVVAADAIRTSAEEIQAHLKTLMPPI
jgi:hypothetical protein